MESYKVFKVLGRVRSLLKRKSAIRARAEELRLSLLPSGITYDRDRVQTSPKERIVETMAKIDELDREYRDITADMMKYKQEMTEWFLVLPEREREVLTLYYVDCKGIRYISDTMQITERHVFRLRKNGVSMLTKETE